MSFPFIPRKVAKRNPNVATAKVNSPLGSVSAPSQPNASSKGKEKAPKGPSVDPEECAILVSLALSEYALWKDSDLRMGLDENDGYGPLHSLLFHCQILAPLRKVPQTLLVKHLKTHLSGALEFRMMVAEPKPWFSHTGGTSHQQDDLGGYEVRPKVSTSPGLSKSDWDRRMVYVENVPVQYRSVPALVKFLLRLLPIQDEPTRFSRVQNVYLPPHHQDSPGDPPTFKGFAVVTFQHQSDAQYVQESWPWQVEIAGSTAESRVRGVLDEVVASEARKFGFRSTSKANWESLRSEYLAHRTRLIEEINASQDTSTLAASSTLPAPLPSVPSGSSHPAYSSEVSLPRVKREAPATTPETPVITASSPYPFGCLVFVKNVHPETNKTTLKTLFGKALTHADGAIDYVDFNKGMDTCYLRLSTPASAQLLLASSGTVVQSSGLDDTGSSPSLEDNDMKAILVEVVTGKREEVYWQKVPEKIRKGAVEKAVKLRFGGEGEDEDEGQGDANEKRSRKRRKR